MRWLPFAGVISVAVLGGVFFGLFSCGGSAWHKQAFFWLFLAAIGIAALLPIRRKHPVLSRIAVVLGAPTLFITAQAAATPFYPGPPASWSEFLQVFISALERGLC